MGTIRKREKNYYAEVCIQGKRKGKSFRLKTKAQQWINEKESKGLDADMTVEQLMEKYRDEVSVGKKGFKWEKARINLLSKMAISQVKLENLSSRHISDWKTERLKKVKESSVNREWTLLSAIFTKAEEWDLLTSHPMKKVERPKNGKSRDRIYTDEEIERILYSCGHSVVGDIFSFALETAMRAGEICNLLWEDVHEGHVHIEESKNGHPRDVPLSTTAKKLIEKQTKDNPVFGLKASSLDTLFRKFRDMALVEGAVFHDTRRTALTRLAKKMPVQDLAKVSGHRDLRILLNTYYNPSINHLSEYFD